MKFNLQLTLLRFALLTSLFFTWSAARANHPIVHAVLFYSPSCPHCHKVITEDLSPLIEKFDEQLFLIAIDTSIQQGSMLYQSSIMHYEIPDNRLGVPTLIVGEEVLVGSVEIPTLFPGIVEKGLAEGGISWPEIPGLRELLEVQGLLDTEHKSTSEETTEEFPDKQSDEERAPINIEPNESPDSTLPEEQVQSNDQRNLNSGEENTEVFSNSSEEEIPRDQIKNDESDNDSKLKDTESGITNDLGRAVSVSENLTLVQRFMRDKTGNTVSVIVLFGMVFSVIGVGATIFRSEIYSKKWSNWVILLLILIGTGVAIYMGFVEVTNTEAVCGPVGDCNTVQQSSYATLFGVIPIGVLGVLGFLIIGILWLFVIVGPIKWQRFSTFSLLALTIFGTLFSIYLTFLEPFVIGATCAWCLTSAIVMTLLLWATVEPVVRVLRFAGNDRRLI